MKRRRPSKCRRPTLSLNPSNFPLFGKYTKLPFDNFFSTRAKTPTSAFIALGRAGSQALRLVDCFFPAGSSISYAQFPSSVWPSTIPTPFGRTADPKNAAMAGDFLLPHSFGRCSGLASLGPSSELSFPRSFSCFPKLIVASVHRFEPVFSGPPYFVKVFWNDSPFQIRTFPS